MSSIRAVSDAEEREARIQAHPENDVAQYFVALHRRESGKGDHGDLGKLVGKDATVYQ